MNQEKKLHGITRSQFFRDAVRGHMGQAGGVGSVRGWMRFFDEEFEKEPATASSTNAIGAAGTNTAGAALEPTKAEIMTFSDLGGVGELPTSIRLICGRADLEGAGFHGIRIKALMTQLNAAWFDGKMNDEQCECIAALLVMYARCSLGELINTGFNTAIGRSALTRFAYIMATIYHETATTMQPVEEYGKGKNHPYGDIDPQTGAAYYGRGYVQLTWRDNYANAENCLVDVNGKPTAISLVWHPELALDPFYAMQITVRGMEEGWFTGKSLSDYLTGSKTDYTNARRVVNGTDAAQRIAGYAKEAECAIRHAMGESIERDLVKGGTRGTDVRELQLLLGLTPDGIAGQKTVAAIMDFQKAHGLNIDGMCGKNTWDALDEYLYGIYPPVKQAAAAHNPYPHTCARQSNGPDQA